MNRAHTVALSIIDPLIEKMLAGNTSIQLYAETSMALEMAHSLGAINVDEYTDYVHKLNRIAQREHEEFMAKMTGGRACTSSPPTENN